MMNDQTRKALEESIAHWKRLEACETKTDFDKEGYDAGDCALCKIYLYKASDVRPKCNGCPVAEKTGQPSCFGTPYWDAEMSINGFLYYKCSLNRAPITAMREFLEGLRK